MAMSLEESITQKTAPHTKANGAGGGLVWPEARRKAGSIASPCQDKWVIPSEIRTVLKRRRSAAEVPWRDNTRSMMQASFCRDGLGMEVKTAEI